MALWQYTFYLLPKESVQKINPDFHFEKTADELFDDAPFWLDQQVTRDFFEEIRLILPKAQSWSTHIDQYGNLESNCFEVLFENDIVESVSFRINYTTDYEYILRQLIEFCILKGLLVVEETWNIVSLNLLDFIKVIETSPQKRKYKILSQSK